MESEDGNTRTLSLKANGKVRRTRTRKSSEEEALFIAKKYLENKTVLELKFAKAVKDGRFLRQSMLETMAAEVSATFNVATRTGKYVEQKIQDMKKEARKFLNLAETEKRPPSAIKVMMEAMADEDVSYRGARTSSWAELDFSDTTSKEEFGSKGDDDYSIVKSQNCDNTKTNDNSENRNKNYLIVDNVENAMAADTTNLLHFFTSPKQKPQGRANPRQPDTYRIRGRQNHRLGRISKKQYPNSHHQAAKSFQKLCNALLEIVPRAVTSFEEACKAQSEYFEQLKIALESLGNN